MHRVVAFAEALGVNVVNDDVTALADPSTPSIVNNHFIFNEDWWVVGAYAIATSLLRARLAINPLRIPVGFPHIRPVERLAQTPDWPQFADFRARPFSLPARTELAVEASNDLAAATERTTVGIWLSDGDWSVPPGEIRTARFTANTASAANVWGAGALTAEQGLDAGSYAVVGMQVFGDADGVLARIIFTNQVARPGVIIDATAGRSSRRIFREGNYGVFGYFDSFALPQLETLGTGAVGAVDVYLDLIRVSS
jgi:hypothetical protein